MAQRRRRLFLVGCLGDPQRAAEILFEPGGMWRNIEKSKEKRARLAAAARTSTQGTDERRAYQLGSSLRISDRARIENEISYTLLATSGDNVPCTIDTLEEPLVMGGGQCNASIEQGFCPTQTARQYKDPQIVCMAGSCTKASLDEKVASTSKCACASSIPMTDGALDGKEDKQAMFSISGNIIGRKPKNGGNHTGCAGGDEAMYTLTAADRHGVALTPSATLSFDTTQLTHKENRSNPQWNDPCHTLSASGEPPAMVHKEGSKQRMVVRRLTPRECERLQGFPDDWTLVPFRGKEAAACADSPRYKAIGNSMAVPVMRWIGEGIMQVEERKRTTDDDA